MRGITGFLLATLAMAGSGPAFAATFALQCEMAGEANETTFLFDTRKSEVLARQPGRGAVLAKFETVEMTYAEVTFARYGMMGNATRKYQVSRSGGPLYESRKRGGWSDWEKIGSCRRL
jgi:hypothetical protein